MLSRLGNVVAYLSIILICVKSDLIYPIFDIRTNLTSYASVPSYAVLPWRFHFSETNITVVDLLYNQTIFDFCNLNAFTPAGVFPLLEIFGIRQADLDAGVQWIAIYTTKYCPLSPDIPYETVYVTNYFTTISLYIQKTGACGFITSAAYGLPSPWTYSFSSTPGVNIKNAYVFDEKVNIFGTALNGYNIENNGIPDFNNFYNSLYSFNALNESFVISVADSFNVNEVWLFPPSSFFYFFRVSNGLILTFTFGCLFRSIYVLRAFLVAKKGKILSFSAVSLLLSIIGNVARMLCWLDPDSVYGISSTLPIELFLSIANSLHLGSSSSSIIVWFDLVDRVKASIKMVFITPSKRKRMLLTILFWFIWLIISILDFYNTYLYIFFFSTSIPTWFISGFELEPTYIIKILSLFILSVIEIGTSLVVVIAVYNIRKGNSVQPLANGQLQVSIVSSSAIRKVEKDLNAKEVYSLSTTSPIATKASTAGNLMSEICEKMVRLAKLMALSGVLMLIAMLIFLVGELNTYNGNVYINSHPYLQYFLGDYSVFFLQLSSCLEVEAVFEVIRKVSG